MHLSLCSVLLLCLAWRDVEWGSWWSQGLGKQVHPHHQTSLVDSIKAGHKEAWDALPTEWTELKIAEGHRRHEQKKSLLPALCQAAVGCTAVWSPHVRVPIQFSSRCEGIVAPWLDQDDVSTHFCPLKKQINNELSIPTYILNLFFLSGDMSNIENKKESGLRLKENTW